MMVIWFGFVGNHVNLYGQFSRIFTRHKSLGVGLWTKVGDILECRFCT